MTPTTKTRPKDHSPIAMIFKGWIHSPHQNPIRTRLKASLLPKPTRRSQVPLVQPSLVQPQPLPRSRQQSPLVSAVPQLEQRSRRS
jgi:hypothetical protein